MDEFDQTIRDRLLAASPGWEARAEAIRERITLMYEEKRRKAATLAWIGTAIGTLILVIGVSALFFGFGTDNTAVIVIGAMMFLFGDGWLTGSKLLYWTWNSRIQLERDIKAVHADVLSVLERMDRLESAAAKPVPDSH